MAHLRPAPPILVRLDAGGCAVWREPGFLDPSSSTRKDRIVFRDRMEPDFSIELVRPPFTGATAVTLAASVAASMAAAPRRET